MIIADLLKNDQFTVVAGNNFINDIKGVYIGDLLSWVMSHAKKGDAWLTVQTHLNVIAIAVLLELSCVIIVEDAPIDEDTIIKANEENVVLIKTDKTAYEVAKFFSNFG